MVSKTAGASWGLFRPNTAGHQATMLPTCWVTNQASAYMAQFDGPEK
jgi:hypothetical protein